MPGRSREGSDGVLAELFDGQSTGNGATDIIWKIFDIFFCEGFGISKSKGVYSGEISVFFFSWERNGNVFFFHFSWKNHRTRVPVPFFLDNDRPIVISDIPRNVVPVRWLGLYASIPLFFCSCTVTL